MWRGVTFLAIIDSVSYVVVIAWLKELKVLVLCHIAYRSEKHISSKLLTGQYKEILMGYDAM